MKPVRSLLFIPANRERWIREAPDKYDADALIFDLEDAVPEDEQETARDNLRRLIPELAEETEQVLSVRVEPSVLFGDLDAVVQPGLDAVMLPKVESIHDIYELDYGLSYLEWKRDIESPIEIHPLQESSIGIYNQFDILNASDRIDVFTAADAPGGDINRAIGHEYSPEGLESLYYRQKTVLEARAAGIDQVFGGVWLDIENTEGLRRRTEQEKQFGCTGAQVIHPSHVPVVNEVFTPDGDEIGRAERIIDALDEAESAGKSAVRFEGEMIDTAHRKSAERTLERARAFGHVD